MRVGKRIALLGFWMGAWILGSGAAHAEEKAWKHKSFDGFVLNAKIKHPKGVKADSVKRIVILIHGSGPSNMDSDLSRASGGKKNLLFRDVSEGLVKAGFSVVRYNKRSYEFQQQIKKNPALMKSQALKDLQTKGLEMLIKDARSFVTWSKKTFPKAKVYLAGFSQGTYIAMQVAHKNPDVAGVVMVGFYATPLLSLVLPQLVYRPLHWFRRHDTNKDGKLSPKELGKAGTMGMKLMAQASILDLDADAKISVAELQAGNFINMLKFQEKLRGYTKTEMGLPPVHQILKQSAFQVMFFQGMLDNQTPAYQAMAIKILAESMWKKKNMKFTFFPGLGHILHPQKTYGDLVYKPMDAKALARMGKEMKAFFK